MSTLDCRNEQRRHAVRAKGWNGLDYVEVSNDQRKLTVFFLGQAPEDLKAENIVIEGCKRGAREVRVLRIRFCYQDDPELDDCLHIYLDRPGDFSKYRLCVVEVDENGEPTKEPFHGFDPRYSCLEVDFKTGCPSDLDCKTEPVCPPEPRVEPDVNYLAKDYASFRQLLLDRMALVMPEWRERHVPDLGIALVELLAYVGDHLSYYQDAVGTEAYLDTARRRTSVRRHVRLVDYPMHEGCNARAWVFVRTSGPFKIKPGDFCITGFQGGPPEDRPLQTFEIANFAGRYEVFEPLFEGEQPIELLPEHNEIPFYTWGERECCLPRGATRATLLDEWPRSEEQDDVPQQYYLPQQDDVPRRKLRLASGDLLLFEEIRGPKTGHAGDADLSHRHVVRLTKVREEVDEALGRLVLEIEWAPEDALPFPLCLSSLDQETCEPVDPVSVARGNVFLVDHGETLRDRELDPVRPRKPVHRCEGEGHPAEVEEIADRFRPRLDRAPLTFREPPPLRKAPASRLLVQDPRKALPEVTLAGWQPRSDLLASSSADRHFTAEVDDDGHAWLRFGDGDCGQAPLAGTKFKATWRVGNGPPGNVGINAIRHLVLVNRPESAGIAVRNPLPARGGTAPEPLDEVRLLAPLAFRRDLRRAVTADDYARLVERDFRGRVQRAAATLLWTGSWYEALVAIDPVGGVEDDALLEEVRRALHRYRRIGHDVEVRWAVPVPLLVELVVCVRSGYLRAHVKAALLEALGARQLADGRRGFFHPDNLTFGQRIALSRLVAAAQSVTGVESVVIRKLERLDRGLMGELAQPMPNATASSPPPPPSFLSLGPFEVARLDNDVRFPGNGRLQLDLRGGR